MKLDEFEIRFDNNRGVFTAGQSVKGAVVLKLTKPMKMKCLMLYFEGRSKSHWEVKQGRSKTDYRASENYINHTMTLFGSGTQITEHPAGFHSYPFNLPIAANLPSSFEGRRGYVRYFCRATIKRPWKFDEHFKRAFTVIHHLDLNFEPIAGMPVWGEAEETVEGCCCTSGVIHVKATLNKTGFVPGEPVNYTIDIGNRSDTHISGLEVELRQVVKYTGYSDSIFSSGNPKFHSKVNTFPLFTGPFNVRKNSEEFLTRSVCVPAVPPSRLDGCGIIDISYHIHIQPVARWSNLKISREILIGTIPLQNPMAGGLPTFNEAVGLGGTPPPGFLGPNGDQVVPTAPCAPSYELTLPPYPEAPPSYEECVLSQRVEIRDETDDEHTQGAGNWAPSYPYYHWNPNTQHFQMVATAQGPSVDPANVTVTTTTDIPLEGSDLPDRPPAYDQL